MTEAIVGDMVTPRTPVVNAAPVDSGRTALLAEPDVELAGCYSAYLGRHGYAVEQTSDGRQALVKAMAVPSPGIIVTNTSLHGIDGYSLVELLRTDSLTSRIPIIVLTTQTEAKAARLVEQARADAVLVQPIRAEALYEEILRVRRASRDARVRSDAARRTAERRLGHARGVMARARQLSRECRRFVTTAPPLEPPSIVCPACNRELFYERSYIGGVNEGSAEQWDTFSCPAGCGHFDYRHRTRRITKAV